MRKLCFLAIILCLGLPSLAAAGDGIPPWRCDCEYCYQHPYETCTAAPFHGGGTGTCSMFVYLFCFPPGALFETNAASCTDSEIPSWLLLPAEADVATETTAAVQKG